VLPFILRRLLTGIPVLIGATALSFFVIRVVPGDAVTTLLNGSPTTPEVEAQIRSQFHLDRSVPVQYGLYMDDLAHGDLGTSMRTGKPVWREISVRLPSTIRLTAAATALTVALGILLGMLGSFFQTGIIARPLALFQFAAVSVPSFWLGLILITLFSFQRHWFPATGDHGWKTLILPSITLALPGAAVLGQLLRDGMREVMSEPYIVTARAKGLRERRVRMRHALRNALIPVVTVSGAIVGSLLTGSVIIEILFARPGVGRLAVDSITNKDLPVVQGVVLLAAAVYLVVNLMVDLIYAAVDPRIRAE
jgi:ABC-type dipeptide/oligopeptide/nickel transport system permease component